MIAYRLIRAGSACLFLLALSLASAAHADDYGVLTVRAGNTEKTLSLEAFSGLPRAELRTVTPFMDGEQHFEGVLLHDLMKVVGVTEPANIGATALDDYSIVIPVSDQASVRIIVADRQNGAPLDPDGMGPYWIIYPSDSGVEKAQDRMIWQLKSLTVR